MNFLEFNSHNNVYRDKSTRELKVKLKSDEQKHNQVLKVNPQISSDPEQASYPKYAENFLKMYKPVHGNQMDLLDKYTDKNNPKDEDWIRSMKSFAASTYN